MGDPRRLGLAGKAIGDAHRATIRAYLLAHLGATNKECAAAVGLNVCVVGRHVNRLRAEWLPSSAEQTADGEPGMTNNLKAPHPSDGRKAT